MAMVQFLIIIVFEARGCVHDRLTKGNLRIPHLHRHCHESRLLPQVRPYHIHDRKRTVINNDQ